jgi:sensor histidine kinase regulating citrate/malate metabolism
MKTKSEYEIKLSNEALQAAQNYYNALTASVNEAQTLRHDIKHTLTAAAELIKHGNSKEALELLSNDVSFEVPMSFCSHPIVNALLNMYAVRMKETGTDFNVKAVLPADIPINSGDICVLLGNLLENAYEACTHISDSNRCAKLRIKSDGNSLTCVVKNSFDGKVLANPISRTYISSRKEKGGIGLVSVKAVCEKYNGEFLAEWTDREFTAYAILNFGT